MIDLRLTHVVRLDKVAYDAWLPKKMVYTLKINYNFIFIWVVDHPKKKTLNTLKKKNLSPLKINLTPPKSWVETKTFPNNNNNKSAQKNHQKIK